MAEKPKVAFYWCASCGGCEEAVVDLAEGVLTVLEAVDIVFWPVAMDSKRADVEAMADGSIAAAFINGAVRTTEQLEMAKLLRRKSACVIAFGSCAQLGGIPSLANATTKKKILEAAFHTLPSVDEGNTTEPELRYGTDGHELRLPDLHEVVRPLDAVIPVDYYLPGCPPTGNIVAEALDHLLHGTMPEHGSVLAPDTALCEGCPRNDTKPEKMQIAAFRRPHEIVADPKVCFLAQGIVCLGLATRRGCEGRCLTANMPCSGCFGPMDAVHDQGAKALSAIASLIEATTEEGIDAALEGIPDPLGTFYRYGLGGSTLRRSLPETRGE